MYFNINIVQRHGIFCNRVLSWCLGVWRAFVTQKRRWKTRNNNNKYGRRPYRVVFMYRYYEYFIIRETIFNWVKHTERWLWIYIFFVFPLCCCRYSICIFNFFWFSFMPSPEPSYIYFSFTLQESIAYCCAVLFMKMAINTISKSKQSLNLLTIFVCAARQTKSHIRKSEKRQNIVHSANAGNWVKHTRKLQLVAKNAMQAVWFCVKMFEF